MTRLLAGLSAFTRAGAWFSGALIMAAAILIGIDVVLRALLRTSIGGADELAGYALAIATAWGLGLALVERAHIRIDSLYGFFPMRMRLALDVFGLAVFLGFFGFALRHGYGVLEQSLRAGSRSQSALQIPTAIPQAIWLAGLAASVLVGLVLLGAALALILRGRTGAATRVISTRSAQEEIAEEIAAAKARAR